ncbi:hypothetical protein RPIT_03890 [Tessaracoccus flavus]|uniref:Transposase IS116/IS110/IS902 C-terminal domain-containing protein n=1 Tax=Tessaracoccus flavus TaxID=1610493 RepID=A0A1Q2CD60_9ACTN|nr:hypothetical protein RPIT_03890 [Tessaracoccus flavus]
MNRLSACLRQYYPAALPLLDDKFDRRDVWAVLAKAPDPGSGRKLTHAQTVTTLKRAGRKRYLDHTAAKILDVLHSDQLAAPPQQSRALAVRTVTLIRILQATRAEIESVEAEMAAAFEQHPDAEIYLSLPGKGHVIGARVLGEFGDDPDRYEDVKARRNYAGTSPLTIASGRQRIVKARHVRPRDWPTPWTGGPSVACRAALGRWTITTRRQLPVTSIMKPSGPSPTDSRASSTAASKHAPSTTRTPPGNTDTSLPLDTLDTWGI